VSPDVNEVPQGDGVKISSYLIVDGVDTIVAIVSVAWRAKLQADTPKPSPLNQLTTKQEQVVIFVF
jgi:hypothetical protein